LKKQNKGELNMSLNPLFQAAWNLGCAVHRVVVQEGKLVDATQILSQSLSPQKRIAARLSLWTDFCFGLGQVGLFL
jgi:hypothetical protein